MGATPTPAPADQQNFHSSRGPLGVVKDLIDLEGVELADAEAIDGRRRALDKLAQAPRGWGNQRTIRPTLTTRAHPSSSHRVHGWSCCARARESAAA